MKPKDVTTPEEFLSAWILGTLNLGSDTAPPRHASQVELRRYVATQLVADLVANKTIPPEEAAEAINIFSNTSAAGIPLAEQVEYDTALTAKLSDPSFIASHGKDIAKIIQSPGDAVSKSLATNFEALRSGNPQLIQNEFQVARGDSIRSALAKPGDNLHNDHVREVFTGGRSDATLPGGLPSTAAKGGLMTILSAGGSSLGKAAPGAAQVLSGLYDVATGNSAWNRPEDQQKEFQKLINEAVALKPPSQRESFREYLTSAADDHYRALKDKALQDYNSRRHPENSSMSMGKRNATYWVGQNTEPVKYLRNSLSSAIGTQAANNVERLAADAVLEPQALVETVRNSASSLRAGKGLKPFGGPAVPVRPGGPMGPGPLNKLWSGAAWANMALDAGQDVGRNIFYNPHVADTFANSGLGEAAKRVATDTLADWGDRTKAISKQIDKGPNEAAKTLGQQSLNALTASDFVPTVATIADQSGYSARSIQNIIGAGASSLFGGDYNRKLVELNDRDRGFDRLVQKQFDPKVTKNWTTSDKVKAFTASVMNPLDYFSARRNSQLEVANRRRVIDGATAYLNRRAPIKPDTFGQNYRGKDRFTNRPRTTPAKSSDFSKPWLDTKLQSPTTPTPAAAPHGQTNG